MWWRERNGTPGRVRNEKMGVDGTFAGAVGGEREEDSEGATTARRQGRGEMRRREVEEMAQREARRRLEVSDVNVCVYVWARCGCEMRESG